MWGKLHYRHIETSRHRKLLIQTAQILSFLHTQTFPFNSFCNPILQILHLISIAQQALAGYTYPIWRQPTEMFATTISSRLQLRLPIEVRLFSCRNRPEVSNTDRGTVGGIYSVLKSKAPVTTAEYGDRYTMIGPLNRQSVSLVPIRSLEVC